jgi:uncharacterized protein (TIGR02466 family)
MLQQDHFWPTTLYFKDHPDPESFNADLEKKILAWSQSDPGLAKTNRSGWHSTTDMHTRPEFAGITRYLVEMQRELYLAEGLAGEPFLGNMWANINYPGSRNATHIHPNCLWSGSYYVTVPANSGNIYFEDPRTPSLMTMPRRSQPEPLNHQRVIQSQPQPGRAIMFPAWLSHGVNENLSDQIRISIAFNFLQR